MKDAINMDEIVIMEVKLKCLDCEHQDTIEIKGKRQNMYDIFGIRMNCSKCRSKDVVFFKRQLKDEKGE